MMKTHELIEQDSANGYNDPRNTVYKVDGKRVDRDTFRDIKSRAVRQDTMHTWNSGGVRFFSCFVTVAE